MAHNNVLLRSAISISVLLHASLLLIPSPGAEASSARLRVEVHVPPPRPEPPRPRRSDRPSARAVKRHPKPDEQPPLPTPRKVMSAPRDTFTVPLKPARPTHAAQRAHGTERDPEAVAALLKATAAKLDREKQETRALRYDLRICHIVKAVLQKHYPDVHILHASPEYSFRLCFRVDPSGSIFDLRMLVPPQTVTRLSMGELRKAIENTSPLPPPPSGLDTPFEFDRLVRFK